MKLLKDSLYLSKSQWRRLFLAMTVMVVALYAVAMVFSLCGSKYFILNYQNEQMTRIENWLTNVGIMPALYCVFTTIEFAIVLAFVLKRMPKWYYLMAFYVIRVLIAIFVGNIPNILSSLYPYLFYLSIPLIEQLIDNKKISGKSYLFSLLQIAIASVITFVLQVIIFAIKNGNFSVENHIINLPTHFIYAIEYDIALAVILFTILLVYREKGDSKLWATSLQVGGSSQTSMKQSLKSNRKKLSKTQKNKLRLLYLKFYLIQLSAFLLLMILPFLLGKVFEFLVMYLAFAVARYILGFKYSLHYKKEVLCITVGIIVFGILALTVPFFYVVVIIAILLGVSLAILLHLSYKYKGFYMFNKIARPDKFAELYVIMDGDLTPHHVAIMCRHKGLDKEQTNIICDFAEGNKKSYIAKKYNYSEKTIERKINEAIDILNKNS